MISLNHQRLGLFPSTLFGLKYWVLIKRKLSLLLRSNLCAGALKISIGHTFASTQMQQNPLRKAICFSKKIGTKRIPLQKTSQAMLL